MPHPPIKYIAFLRGINVGGNKKVPMADLKKMLEKMGFENVKTLLASGNVLFETEKTDPKILIRKIEKQFEATFGFISSIIIRTFADLEKLKASDPFKGITVTPETRLYITFLAEKSASTLPIPYTSPEKALRILRVTDHEICSVLTLNPKVDTVKLMGFLEKEYGKNVTTRNWNTVMKIIG